MYNNNQQGSHFQNSKKDIVCPKMELIMTHLENAQGPSNHDKQIRFVCEHPHAAGDDTKHGIDEESEGRDAEQDVIEVRLVFGTELQ